MSCCVNRQPGCYGAARASAPTMTKLYRHYLPCFLHKSSVEKAVFSCKVLSGTPADMTITVGADIMGIMWTSRTGIPRYIRDKKKNIIYELSCTRTKGFLFFFLYAWFVFAWPHEMAFHPCLLALRSSRCLCISKDWQSCKCCYCLLQLKLLNHFRYLNKVKINRKIEKINK